MADIGFNYSADEDGIIRLQKDLNYLLTHLDHQNVRTLYTEYCNIQSAGGETYINGPLLTMRAVGSTITRLLAGYDATTSDFVFKLYDSLGNENISLNSSGEAVFSGNIYTSKNAYVGHDIHLGSSDNTTDNRHIFFHWQGSTDLVIIKTTEDNVGGIAHHDLIIQCEALEVRAVHQFNVETSGDSYIGPNESSDGNFGSVYLGHRYKNAYVGDANYSTMRIATEGYTRQRDIAMDLDYFCGRNTKTIINAFTTATLVPASTLNTVVLASTNSIICRSAIRIKCTTNTTGQYIMAASTFASKTIAAFNDNSVATSDDYLVFVFYLDSTAAVSTTGGVFLQIGSDATTNFTYRYNTPIGYPITTGTNVIARKIGSYYSIGGAPSYADIKFVRVGYQTAIASSGLGITPDYVGIHRAIGTTWSDFQIERNSTWVNLWSQYGDKYMITEFSTEIVLCSLVPGGTVNAIYLNKGALSNFKLEATVRCMRDGQTPAITWFDDSTGDYNTLEAYVDSHVFYIDFYKNSTLVDWIESNVPVLSRNDVVKFHIMKDYYGWITGTYKVNGDVTKIRTVKGLTPFVGSTTYGSIVLGSIWSSAYGQFSELKFGPYNSQEEV